MNVPESGGGDDVDGCMAERKLLIFNWSSLSRRTHDKRHRLTISARFLKKHGRHCHQEREEAAKLSVILLSIPNCWIGLTSSAFSVKATRRFVQSVKHRRKEDAKTLRAELDAKNAQIQRLENEGRQWKERNAQLLMKYNRIGPNDVQALKDEIEDLQIDLRKAEEEKAAYTTEKDARTKLFEDTLVTLADFRMKYSSLGQEPRDRLGQLNHHIFKLKETVAELRRQVKGLSDEKERLASQAAAAATPSDSNVEVESLRTQLAVVVQEKETSAKLLAELSKVAKSACDHEAALSALCEERAKLFTEKASGQNGVAAVESTDVAQVRQQLESEKVELTKALDDALARAKNAEECALKALHGVRNFRLQNQFQARIA
ncbi:hypothetical protein ACEPAG_8345 [Sanghuangporus baumii]